MLTPISQADQALRDTVIVRAEGAALRRVSKLWGVPMPSGWHEPSWREGLNSAAMGPRGTLPTSFAFLEGIFGWADESIEVVLDPANPQRLTATAGAGTFDQSHVHRFVRIAGDVGTGLYWTVGPADVVADGGSRVELARIGTAWWDPSDWTVFAVSQTVTATVLAFTIQEATPGSDTPKDLGDPCVLKVWLETVSSAVPPSYLQPPSQWMLYDVEIASFTEGARLSGAVSGAVGRIRRVVDNGAEGAIEIVVEGSAVFLDNEPLTDDAGGSATCNGTMGNMVLAYDNEAAGGFAIGNTVAGAAADPMSAVVRGLQDDGASGLLCLEYVSGQPALDNEQLTVAAVVRGQADGDSLSLDRPTGEPGGGQLSRTEFVDGTFPATRAPLYMIGAGVSPEAAAALNLLLPAGYRAKMTKTGF